MKVVFRADASRHIGSGHVSRCLNLARTLAARGAQCTFACAASDMDPARAIAAAGFQCARLESFAGEEKDADASLRLVRTIRPDWLVVDHYSLGSAWESALRDSASRIAVVDDLARGHDCDLLVDQGFGRDPSEYDGHVPAGCEVLAGSSFALLAPEFAVARRHLAPRRIEVRSEILVSLGGVDAMNATASVLRALMGDTRAARSRITVLLGTGAPHLEAVRTLLEGHGSIRLVVGTKDMPAEIAQSTLAVGAGGVSALERCCLGLPSITVIVAENQRRGVEALAAAGALSAIATPEAIAGSLPAELASLLDPGRHAAMAQAALAVTDGAGCARVAKRMLQE